MTLTLYNTLTRKKERFEPLDPGNVRMYVCGMTIYDLCHMGHARMMMAFDVVYRWLCTLGYRVTYVRNITDVDDKINAAAREQGVPISDITDRFTATYREDVAALGVAAPDLEPAATAHIGPIVAMIETNQLLLDEVVGVRAEGAGTRTLVFEGPSLSVELELDGDRLVGQLVPPAAGRVVVEAVDASLAAGGAQVPVADVRALAQAGGGTPTRAAAGDSRIEVPAWG